MFHRGFKPTLGRWVRGMMLAGVVAAASSQVQAGLSAKGVQLPSEGCFTDSLPTFGSFPQATDQLPGNSRLTTDYDFLAPRLGFNTTPGRSDVFYRTDAQAAGRSGHDDLLSLQNGVGALADFNEGVVIQNPRSVGETVAPSNGNASAIPLLPAAWSGLSGMLTVVGLTLVGRMRRVLR